MKVKFDRVIKNDIEIELDDDVVNAHAGDVIVEFDEGRNSEGLNGIFKPLFVIKTLFSRIDAEKYGLDSEEIFQYGLGHVVCIDDHGNIRRLHYHEYRTLKNPEEIRNQFIECWGTPQEIREILEKRKVGD